MSDTMKCLSCHKDIPVGSGFCPYCGAVVEGAVVDPEGNTTVLGVGMSPFEQNNVQPEPQPAWQPTPEPVQQPAWQSAPEPAPQPAWQPAPEPAPQPAWQPAPQPEPQTYNQAPPQNQGYYQNVPNQSATQPPMTNMDMTVGSPMMQPPMGQQPMYQPPMGQPPMYQQPMSMAPLKQLKTNRGLAKFILLSIITFGIYAIVLMTCISDDINVIASRYDGKKTMNYCLMFFIVGPITLGIYSIVWMHSISARIGNELQRRGIDYSFGASDFWLWCVLGSLIIVGPFIYYHKFLKAMNLLSENYNIYG